MTGDAGFLGRHFRAGLERRGYQILGLDARRPFGDCRQWFNHEPLFQRERFDLVVHCAAVVGGRAMIDGDPLATSGNLDLDASMMRWAARARPGRVVYLSSSAVYPRELQMSVPYWLAEEEQQPGVDVEFLEPDQVYGWSKLVGEVLAGRLREAGVPVTVVRPFSGYGPDQDHTYPFPAFLARARDREDPFQVWGDGTQVRDLIHVDDVVAGTLAAVDQQVDGPLNLCTGRPTSFLELARMVCDAAGYQPRITPLPGAPVGVRFRVGDPTRMLTVYQPTVTLGEGIRRALKEAQ